MSVTLDFAQGRPFDGSGKGVFLPFAIFVTFI